MTPGRTADSPNKRKNLMRSTVPVAFLVVLAAVAVAVLVGLVLVPHGQSLSKAHEPSSPSAPEWLVALAQKTATNMGDSSPASAVWALTTYGKSGQSLGGTAEDLGRHPDQQVYLVVMTGHFVNKASFSPNGGDQKGSTLVFGVDPVTHSINDLGLSNVAATTMAVEHVSPLVL